MKRTFVKYHGAGNDFVMVDEMDGHWLDISQIAKACERRTGIGADGFIRLTSAIEMPGVAFQVLYYNADGQLGSLCGNGSRCAVEWAFQLNLFQGDSVAFAASDGVHHAVRMPDGSVTVNMSTAKAPIDQFNGSYIDTGSPHHVMIVEDVNDVDVAQIGRNIRYDDYGDAGANVNWVSQAEDGHWSIRTYERGVEDETLSCGTGAVASALVLASKMDATSPLTLQARGGELTVAWDEILCGGFEGIRLTGPTQKVFEGNWPW